MTLSVLIPAYQERKTIADIIERVLRQPRVSQVIIVDDGSTDGTREFLESIDGKDPRIQICFHAHNRGKGAAIRTALPFAHSDICIIQDADLEYSPMDFESVIAPIVNGTTKVVYGSRVLHGENEYPIDRFRVGSYIVTKAANWLYRAKLTDEPTGYKAFETQFLQSLPLESTGFEICPELTAWTRKRGETIIEVPIRYDRRTVAEGKKIRWTDGTMALWTLLRLRLK